ncbi:unnamed protein product [Owenia fusiformis]|uniref:Uncharacterized protein n=1 Tax=Owenia fusiformis TaxID=6347 RepID=A0A8S4P0W7_OWEFU|nr:unnamed protein product [Owenia fusiformis]
MPTAGEAKARVQGAKTPSQAGQKENIRQTVHSVKSKIPVASSKSSVKKSVKLNKARPIPDFNKLHQNWSDRFERGKACSKKPCTVASEFVLTKSGKKIRPNKPQDVYDHKQYEDEDEEFFDQNALDKVVAYKEPGSHARPVKRKILGELAAEFNKPPSERSPRSPIVALDDEDFGFKTDAGALESILDNTGISSNFNAKTPVSHSTMAARHKSPHTGLRPSIYYKGPGTRTTTTNRAYTDIQSRTMSRTTLDARLQVPGLERAAGGTSKQQQQEQPRQSIYYAGTAKSKKAHQKKVPKTPGTAARVRLLQTKSPAMRSPAFRKTQKVPASCSAVRWSDVLHHSNIKNKPVDNLAMRLFEGEDQTEDAMNLQARKVSQIGHLSTDSKAQDIKIEELVENSKDQVNSPMFESLDIDREAAFKKLKEIEEMERLLERDIEAMETVKISPSNQLTQPSIQLTQPSTQLIQPSNQLPSHLSVTQPKRSLSPFGSSPRECDINPNVVNTEGQPFRWTDKGSPVRPASKTPPEYSQSYTSGFIQDNPPQLRQDNVPQFRQNNPSQFRQDSFAQSKLENASQFTYENTHVKQLNFHENMKTNLHKLQPGGRTTGISLVKQEFLDDEMTGLHGAHDTQPQYGQAFTMLQEPQNHNILQLQGSQNNNGIPQLQGPQNPQLFQNQIEPNHVNVMQTPAFVASNYTNVNNAIPENHAQQAHMLSTPQGHLEQHEEDDIIHQMNDIEQRINESICETIDSHSTTDFQTNIVNEVQRISSVVENMMKHQSKQTNQEPITHQSEILKQLQDIGAKMELMMHQQQAQNSVHRQAHTYNPQQSQAQQLHQQTHTEASCAQEEHNEPPQTKIPSLQMLQNDQAYMQSPELLRQQSCDIQTSDKSLAIIPGEHSAKALGLQQYRTPTTLMSSLSAFPKMSIIPEDSNTPPPLQQVTPTQQHATPTQQQATPTHIEPTPIQNKATPNFLTPTMPSPGVPFMQYMSPVPQLLTPVVVKPQVFTDSVSIKTEESGDNDPTTAGDFQTLLSDLEKQIAGSVELNIKNKFLDILIDEECAIYACRQMTQYTPKMSRCRDPVAFNLTDGDDRHFIPIRDACWSKKPAGTSFTVYTKDL